MSELNAIRQDVYNFKTTELVNGYPPTTGHILGDRAYVYDSTTKELVSIFRFVFGEWYKIGSAV
jgi:hypothetical protein